MASPLPNVTFPGFSNPSDDFQRVRDGRQTGPFIYEVDLGDSATFGAGRPLILPLVGNVFYVDRIESCGNANVTFQDVSAVNSYITVKAGDVYHVPFTQVKISAAQQPGKKLRIVYGVDIDFNTASLPVVTSIDRQVIGSFTTNFSTSGNNSRTVFTLAEDSGYVGRYMRVSFCGYAKQIFQLSLCLYHASADNTYLQRTFPVDLQFSYIGTSVGFSGVAEFLFPEYLAMASVNKPSQAPGGISLGGVSAVFDDYANTAALITNMIGIITREP